MSVVIDRPYSSNASATWISLGCGYDWKNFIFVTLGVVSTNGAGKNPTYTLLDTPIAHKFEAMLAAA